MAEDDDHYQGRHRERSGCTPTGNLRKLIAAGAIAAGGLLANRALSEPEMPPAIPPAPARTIPGVPIPEEEPEADRWVLRVQVPDKGMASREP